MYCPKCGKENAEGVVFCGTCGAQLPQSGQTGAVFNPGFKKLNVWLTVLYTIITGGIYLPVWFLSRRDAINKMNSAKKIGKGLFIFVIVLYVINILASFGAGFEIGMNGAEDDTSNMLDGLSALASIIAGIILIVQAFKLRTIFNDHFAAKGEKFSGIWTFLGNIWYFQHKVNKLFY